MKSSPFELLRSTYEYRLTALLGLGFWFEPAAHDAQKSPAHLPEARGPSVE
jgi:hypothetical protein